MARRLPLAIERRTHSQREWWAIGDDWSVAQTQSSLALDYYRLGDLQHALDLYQQALATQDRQGDPQEIAHALDGIALVLAARGQDAQAVLYGAAEWCCLRGGVSGTDADRAAHEAMLAAVRTRLGDERFAAARAQDAAMPTASAISLAHTVGEEGGGQSPPVSTWPATA